MDILQIVPQLPPAINGLGDYAFLLARKLRAAHGVDSRFIVGDPDCEYARSIEGFAVECLPSRTASGLSGLLQRMSGGDATVLLHYVGYGYAKRGCPFWLVDGLEQWRQRGGDRRLVTMFHELYAKGPIWSSSFWASAFQKWLAKRLADISDNCRTSMKMYARILEQMSPRHQDGIPAFPVISNVGEASQWLSLATRRRQVVMFGSPVWRREIYTRHAAALVRTCQALRAERIVDIGAPTGMKLELQVPVVELGRQSAERVSLLLAESRAGFVSYFDGYLAKSSIFAALCAHSVLPVLPYRNASELDGIRADNEYLAASDIPSDLPDSQIQTIADNALAWYQGHSLEKTAASFAASLHRNEPVNCRC